MSEKPTKIDRKTQTKLRIYPIVFDTEHEKASVVADERCQTATSLPPKNSNTNFFSLLEFVPYQEIQKNSIKVFELPRKSYIQWKLPTGSDTSISDTDSFLQVGKKGVLRSSGSFFSGNVKQIACNKSLIMKAVVDSDAQTELRVSPHLLEEDEVATVYSELSTQTSLTFNPDASKTKVIILLQENFHHNSTPTNVEETSDVLAEDYMPPSRRNIEKEPRGEKSTQADVTPFIDIDIEEVHRKIKSLVDSTVQTMEAHLHEMLKAYNESLQIDITDSEKNLIARKTLENIIEQKVLNLDKHLDEEKVKKSLNADEAPREEQSVISDIPAEVSPEDEGEALRTTEEESPIASEPTDTIEVQAFEASKEYEEEALNIPPENPEEIARTIEEDSPMISEPPDIVQTQATEDEVEESTIPAEVLPENVGDVLETTEETEEKEIPALEVPQDTVEEQAAEEPTKEETAPIDQDKQAKLEYPDMEKYPWACTCKLDQLNAAGAAKEHEPIAPVMNEAVSVGDSPRTKREILIECECHPSASGAAPPSLEPINGEVQFEYITCQCSDNGEEIIAVPENFVSCDCQSEFSDAIKHLLLDDFTSCLCSLEEKSVSSKVKKNVATPAAEDIPRTLATCEDVLKQGNACCNCTMKKPSLSPKPSKCRCGVKQSVEFVSESTSTELVIPDDFVGCECSPEEVQSEHIPTVCACSPEVKQPPCEPETCIPSEIIAAVGFICCDCGGGVVTSDKNENDELKEEEKILDDVVCCDCGGEITKQEERSPVVTFISCECSAGDYIESFKDKYIPCQCREEDPVTQPTFSPLQSPPGNIPPSPQIDIDLPTNPTEGFLNCQCSLETPPAKNTECCECPPESASVEFVACECSTEQLLVKKIEFCECLIKTCTIKETGYCECSQEIPTASVEDEKVNIGEKKDFNPCVCSEENEKPLKFNIGNKEAEEIAQKVIDAICDKVICNCDNTIGTPEDKLLEKSQPTKEQAYEIRICNCHIKTVPSIKKEATTVEKIEEDPGKLCNCDTLQKGEKNLKMGEQKNLASGQTLLFEYDNEYVEPYMQSLEAEVIKKGRKSMTSIPSIIYDTCKKEIEIPWDKIELPNVATYELKLSKKDLSLEDFKKVKPEEKQEEFPDKEIITEKASAGEAEAEEAPHEEAPSEEAPPEEAPEEAPPEEAPPEEAPPEEPLAEVVPEEEVPAEDAPIQEELAEIAPPVPLTEAAPEAPEPVKSLKKAFFSEMEPTMKAVRVSELRDVIKPHEFGEQTKPLSQNPNECLFDEDRFYVEQYLEELDKEFNEEEYRDHEAAFQKCDAKPELPWYDILIPTNVVILKSPSKYPNIMNPNCICGEEDRKVEIEYCTCSEPSPSKRVELCECPKEEVVRPLTPTEEIEICSCDYTLPTPEKKNIDATCNCETNPPPTQTTCAANNPPNLCAANEPPKTITFHDDDCSCQPVNDPCAANNLPKDDNRKCATLCETKDIVENLNCSNCDSRYQISFQANTEITNECCAKQSVTAEIGYCNCESTPKMPEPKSTKIKIAQVVKDSKSNSGDCTCGTLPESPTLDEVFISCKCDSTPHVPSQKHTETNKVESKASAAGDQLNKGKPEVEFDVEISFAEVHSEYISVAGGAASQHTTASVVSDNRIKAKRCPKDFIVTIQSGNQTKQIRPGPYPQTHQTGSLALMVSTNQNENDEVSGLTINIKPSSADAGKFEYIPQFPKSGSTLLNIVNPAAIVTCAPAACTLPTETKSLVSTKVEVKMSVKSIGKEEVRETTSMPAVPSRGSMKYSGSRSKKKCGCVDLKPSFSGKKEKEIIKAQEKKKDKLKENENLITLTAPVVSPKKVSETPAMDYYKESRPPCKCQNAREAQWLKERKAAEQARLEGIDVTTAKECICPGPPKKDVIKNDPVMTALEAYQAEMKPLRDALQTLREKIRDLNIPETNALMKPSQEDYSRPRGRKPTPSLLKDMCTPCGRQPSAAEVLFPYQRSAPTSSPLATSNLAPPIMANEPVAQQLMNISNLMPGGAPGAFGASCPCPGFQPPGFNQNAADYGGNVMNMYDDPCICSPMTGTMRGMDQYGFMGPSGNVNPMGQMSPLNTMGQMTPLSPMGQMPPLNPMGQMVSINPMSPMGQMPTFNQMPPMGQPCLNTTMGGFHAQQQVRFAQPGNLMNTNNSYGVCPSFAGVPSTPVGMPRNVASRMIDAGTASYGTSCNCPSGPSRGSGSSSQRGHNIMDYNLQPCSCGFPNFPQVPSYPEPPLPLSEISSYSETSYSSSNTDSRSRDCSCKRKKKKKHKKKKHRSRSSSRSSGRSRDSFSCPFMEALREMSLKGMSRKESRKEHKKVAQKTSSKIEVHFKKKGKKSKSKEAVVKEKVPSGQSIMYRYRISVSPRPSSKEKDKEKECKKNSCPAAESCSIRRPKSPRSASTSSGETSGSSKRSVSSRSSITIKKKKRSR